MKKDYFKYLCKVLFTIIIIGAPQYYLLHRNLSWQIMLIVLIASVLILVFSNLNLFTEMTIKKDGVSLKLREAQKIVDQAYASMDLMKSSMEPVIKFQFEMIEKGYFPTYVQYEDVLKTIESLESVAENLNMDESIKKLFNKKNNIVARQAAYNIISFLELQKIGSPATLLQLHDSLNKGLPHFVKHINKELLKLNANDEAEAWYIFETKKVLEFITKKDIEIQQKRS